MPSKLVSAPQAAAHIADKAVLSVSSSSALGCPDLVLRAIGERFEREGRPRGLTALHPIAAGDMYGVGGIDHLAQDGLLATVLAGSYPSGPSKKPMPRIWRMIVDNKVAAYNVPSGIMFDMHREASARRPGVVTKVGIETFVDPQRGGCAMNERARQLPIVRRVEFDGGSWLHFASIRPTVAILRATTADDRGNLSYEHEGAYLGGLDQAIAVRCCGGTVIAQVKRQATAGSLRTREVHVPGNLVDMVVVDANQTQTTETRHDPAISGEVRRPWDSFEPVGHTVEKVIARRAALELRAEDTAALGFGICALVPRVLAEEGWPQSVTWVIEQGAVGGMPLTGFAFGCAVNADAFVPSASQFAYLQGAGFDQAFLSFLEIGKSGDVNVSKLGKAPHLTAGCGGFVDITANARKIVFAGFFEAGAALSLDDEGIRVTSAGKFAKIVDEVEQVTFNAGQARDAGADVVYVTERCVMRASSGSLVAEELMPGIDPQRDIVEASGNLVRIARDARRMPSTLVRNAPMGLEL